MHRDEMDRWRHRHEYQADVSGHGERRTRQVIALTAVMMFVEIAAGYAFNSMALLADGWHMASHASALGITAFAYAYARRHAGSDRYSFGTWKVSVLGGYTSAVVLAVIALMIAVESSTRFFEPLVIQFDQAIVVAVVGLAVNLLSAYLLRGQHDHGHHGHDHSHGHDHNLRAAYLHVLADALTSVTAIVALTAGRSLGWHWMDPMMGLVGSLVIARWSYGLLRETSAILLDGAVDERIVREMREHLEDDADNGLADLHLWRVGPDDLAGIISVVTHEPKSPEYYRAIAEQVHPVSHLTVEVNACPKQRGVARGPT